LWANAGDQAEAMRRALSVRPLLVRVQEERLGFWKSAVLWEGWAARAFVGWDLAAERAVLQSGQLLARFLNLFAFCKHSFTKRKQ
jgi:hypothetical protein